MYQYIKGFVEEIGEGYIVVENNGIGYMINTSKTSIASLNTENKNVKIYTYLNVREDDMSLFGFTTKEELDMFKLLILISGIGPKVALGILSTLNPSDIKIAIINNDIDKLSKAPGIGKKTGKRIILELKDKIDDNINVEEYQEIIEKNNDLDEAISALTSLGYTRSEIKSALSKFDKSGLNAEEIIKTALKFLAK